MKKKINYYLVATALFVAIATMISMTVINYYLFQKQVKEDLQVMAETIESTGILKQDINEIPQIDVEGIRVTWIDKMAQCCMNNQRCDKLGTMATDRKLNLHLIKARETA